MRQTGTMSGTTTKLTTAVDGYFADLRRIRASGGATQERSLYGPLDNLLTAVGATLRPKVFCVQELADQGAGHPDFGLYAAKQVQKGAPSEGQTPERGVVEVKSPADDAWLTAAGGQASRYWERYRLVLVTNARDFVLVGEDADGKPATLETFRLAGSGDEFLHRLEKPRAFARAAGASLGEYLARALSHRAALAEPKDLAWLLASYARDGLARVEAAGGAPQRRCARRLRKRLASGSRVNGAGASSARRWCKRCSTASSPLGCCGRVLTLQKQGRDRWSPAVPTPLGSAGAKPSGISAHLCSERCFSRSPIQVACNHSV